MATKTIKSYDDRQMEARSKRNRAGKELDKKFNFENMDKYDQARADLEGARIDRRRISNKKPKGMSAREWGRQVRSGEAMIQNPNEAKMKPTYSRLIYDKAEQVKPSGPKKPTEFIITTVREPKKIENPKAAARAKARAVLKRMKAKKN